MGQGLKQAEHTVGAGGGQQREGRRAQWTLKEPGRGAAHTVRLDGVHPNRSYACPEGSVGKNPSYLFLRSTGLEPGLSVHTAPTLGGECPAERARQRELKKGLDVAWCAKTPFFCCLPFGKSNTSEFTPSLCGILKMTSLFEHNPEHLKTKTNKLQN